LKKQVFFYFYPPYSSLLRQIVKCAFAMRRKIFSTCLAAGLNISKQQATDYIVASGKDAQARGETFTTQDFVNLTNLIKNDNKNSL